MYTTFVIGRTMTRVIDRMQVSRDLGHRIKEARA